MPLTRVVTTVIAVVAVAGLVGCSIIPEPDLKPSGELAPSSQPEQPRPEKPRLERSGGQNDDFTERMRERDAFMRDQQLPLDGSLLSAVTPEQKRFVDEQRAHVEASGGVFSPEDESYILALTADACESAILNGHSIDNSLFDMHIATSPLFDMLDHGAKEQEAGAADIMVYGMQYLCPADFDDWVKVFKERYPDYRQ